MSGAADHELHRLDPKNLTAAEKAALRIASRVTLYRVKSGYQGRGVKRVSLQIAERLKAKGLAAARIDGAHTLAVTGAGKTVLAVMAQRAGR